MELGEIEAGLTKAAAGLLSTCAVKLDDGFLVAYCQAENLRTSNEPLTNRTTLSIFVAFYYTLHFNRVEKRVQPQHFFLEQRLCISAE